MKKLKTFWRKNGPEFLAAIRGGFPPFVGAAHPQRPLSGIPVFCYHVVKPEVLAADLSFLQREGYVTLRGDDFLDVLGETRPFTGREVVLTFDDGPVEMFRDYFPLLKRYSCQAILFVCPGLHREANAENGSEDRPCTWEELREMESSGHVDVQAHTLEHRSLVNWPEALPLTGVSEQSLRGRRKDPLSVEEDLAEARRCLETQLGKRVEHLAWPQYVAGAEAVAAALAAGYRGMWAGIQTKRAWGIPGDSAIDIPRISGEFLRRLPGEDRCKLAVLLRDRYRKVLFHRFR